MNIVDIIITNPYKAVAFISLCFNLLLIRRGFKFSDAQYNKQIKSLEASIGIANDKIKEITDENEKLKSKIKSHKSKPINYPKGNIA